MTKQMPFVVDGKKRDKQSVYIEEETKSDSIHVVILLTHWKISFIYILYLLTFEIK